MDTYISFRLARTDPAGHPMPEPGILRYGGFDARNWINPSPQDSLLDKNLWPVDQYINVCIADQSILSYASYPVSTYSHPFCNTEVRNDNLTWHEYWLARSDTGKHIVYNGIVLSFYARFSSSLAHELGHYLGLLHNFGEECDELRWPIGMNDCIDDTQFYNEKEFTTDLYRNKIFRECHTGKVVTHDNIMDYSRNYKQALKSAVGFSFDQRDRMHDVLKYCLWVKELKYSDK